MPSLPITLKISVIETLETNKTYKEILDVVKQGEDQVGLLETSWAEENDAPILVISTNSIENFEAVYTRAFPIMDRIMQLVLDQGFDLSSFFPDDEINSEDPPYLILKYATNYKKPMHENFQYYQWFATQVKDYITYEEVDDGFIRFYKREVDFLNDNMIRTTKEGLQNWIESKRAKIPPQIVQEIIKLFS